MRVLLVDDSAFMRHIVKNIVIAAGHEVVGEGENGQIGVELYEALKPDVVFLDITMPIMSGIDAVKVIRQKNPEANVVMCSAMGQQWLVMDAIKSGATEFIVKPFKPETIVNLLKRMKV